MHFTVSADEAHATKSNHKTKSNYFTVAESVATTLITDPFFHLNSADGSSLMKMFNRHVPT